MISKKMNVVTAVLTLSIFIYVPVTYAVESSATNTTTPSTATSRTLERQAKLNEKLTDAQAARIKLRCTAAQNIVVSTTKKVTDYNDPIVANYNRLIEQINTLLKQRASTGKNIGELSGNAATVTQKYQTYKLSYETVKTDLSDLSTLDCTTNPTGFSATLKQSRADLQTMRTNRADLNAFTKSSILKDLQTIKKEG